MTGRFDAITFDFDGVLVDSVDVKTRAFAALYAPCGPEIVRYVVDYHLAHAGISRFVKFRHWQEELLGRTYLDEDGERLSAEFSRIVVDAVVACPYLVGVQEFLEKHFREIPLHVVSGTPESELLEIVAKRRMERYFVSVHGSPAGKGAILRNIIAAHRYEPERVLMVGDAMADLVGARDAGTAFVGCVTGVTNPFPSEVVVLPDLDGLARFL